MNPHDKQPVSKLAEPQRVTPQMMSQVFAKSVNNTDPEHQHVYDHRIAADALNALLTPAHAAEQPKLTENENEKSK